MPVDELLWMPQCPEMIQKHLPPMVISTMGKSQDLHGINLANKADEETQ